MSEQIPTFFYFQGIAFNWAMSLDGIFYRYSKCRVYIDTDVEYEVMMCTSHLNNITSVAKVLALVLLYNNTQARTIIYDDKVTYLNDNLALAKGVNIISVEYTYR